MCLGIWVRTYTLPGEVWVRMKARGKGSKEEGEGEGGKAVRVSQKMCARTRSGEAPGFWLLFSCWTMKLL